jgi:pimeloyl-ACP methyl ester carboxylesterase
MKTAKILFLIFSYILVTGCATDKYTIADVEKDISHHSTAESKFVKVGNYNIHYIEEGNGEPMIMIHGWLCWGAYWKKVIPLVKDQYHVYAPDLLGHGISDKPLGKEVSYGTEAQAERIIAFMNTLGIKKAYIVGHSMGGEIAAKVAFLAPDRVKGLVLICAAGMEKTPKLLPWHVRLGRALHFDNLAWMMSKTIIRINTPSLMFYKENPMPDEFVNDLVMTNLNNMTDRKAMVKATKEGLFQNFMDERCKDINVPTLVISAKHDRVIPPETQEQYSNLIPGAQYVCIDKAGHMAPWEQPDQVAANIMNVMK